jgi:hypothetical protein
MLKQSGIIGVKLKAVNIETKLLVYESKNFSKILLKIYDLTSAILPNLRGHDNNLWKKAGGLETFRRFNCLQEFEKLL